MVSGDVPTGPGTQALPRGVSCSCPFIHPSSHSFVKPVIVTMDEAPDTTSELGMVKLNIRKGKVQMS